MTARTKLAIVSQTDDPSAFVVRGPLPALW